MEQLFLKGIAAIFLAYLFGLDLSAMATVTVFIVAMLASIGAPGIPSGSMAGMQMVLPAVGIPLEGILILLLVERPLDTIRTAANVLGDPVGCVVIDRHADPLRSYRQVRVLRNQTNFFARLTRVRCNGQTTPLPGAYWDTAIRTSPPGPDGNYNMLGREHARIL
ncbi:MAG: hypothetical protein CM1200mP9_12140 [Gammaproteobacteria bacterium]|nr:MAG: hypothetical protein CM1200mP9_12140 [Gammaproteobacteria bacterium]